MEQYMKPRALQEVALPHTIRDAMAWTKALGERYLWVNCLCVIQDVDANAMNHVLKAMGHIYATAELTIVAANGDHANSGLPGFGQLSKMDIKGPIKDTWSKYVDLIWPHNSTWNSRGWTFQEALYSRRLLLFPSESQIIWLCAQTVRHATYLKELNFGGPENVGWYRSMGLPISIKSMSSDLVPLKDWAAVVDSYTKRHLSFEEDFERAFAGARYGFGPKFPGNVVHGFPQFFFDICMLWLPHLQNTTRRTNHPTWSWTGWTGDSICETSWMPYLYFRKWVLEDGQEPSPPEPIVRLTAKARYTLEGSGFGAEEWFNGFYKYQEYRYDELMEPPKSWQRHGKGKDQFFTRLEDKDGNNKYPWPLPDINQYPGTSSDVTFTALRCETQVATLDAVDTSGGYALDLMCNGELVGSMKPDLMSVYHEQLDSQSVSCDVIVISHGHVERPEYVRSTLYLSRLLACAGIKDIRGGRYRYGEYHDYYNVLWVGWENGVAVRRGIGIVLQDAWDSLETKTISFILG
ncbi:hypothetical protein E8E13_003203 [Curvularia kusanoi]|uniref:Heterokaryon incompatibility domain-containing protein n=1 Tax=Curvularia kusanoi TaxID=90978 RepID=A0A9P4T773_CURKU|nr:hypothetical protein E8E13_003203 [Curvularia kusanoi]